MDSGYPDSVNSSPCSREIDSDHRWDARDSVGGFRYRLMCSYGGKIQQRSHDNQLSYVGGDTHILAVDRNIGYASMNAKLSSLWATSVSFKYQLPNEDLDALVSVTNDEDMENMMVEYDRLQKIGDRFSWLRLFVFANKPDCSSQGSLGSVMEETKQDNSFVDALNVGPVSRLSENAPHGPWIHNIPNYSSRLEGIGGKGDCSSAQRGYAADQTNTKEHELYMGRELQQQDVQSAPYSPIIGYSSVDYIASAPARINTSAPHRGSDYRVSKQAEMGVHLGHGFEQDIDSRIQEFQKLQLRQPQDPIAWPVDDNANHNIPGRRIYSDPVRAVNLSNQDMTRPNPVDVAYMTQQQQIQQNPSQSEYYMHDQGSHFVSQSYWQMQEPHGDQQYHPVYFVQAGTPMLQQPMSAIRPMGQPVPGSGGHYNTVQRMSAPMQIYSPEAAPLSNPVTNVLPGAAIQRQNGSDPTEPHRTLIQIPAPVHRGPYTSVPSEPMASDVRVVYRSTAPVPLAHTEPHSYQNVVYEPNARQIYYMQPPPATIPQDQLMNPEM